MLNSSQEKLATAAVVAERQHESDRQQAEAVAARAQLAKEAAHAAERQHQEAARVAAEHMAQAAQAEAALRKWRGLVTGIEPAPSPLPGVISALSDDLNTSAAVAELHAAAARGDYAGLLASAQFLGVLTSELGGWVRKVDLMPFVLRLSELRRVAIETKDFSDVDALRARLLNAGIEVRMNQGVQLSIGPKFDPDKFGDLQ